MRKFPRLTIGRARELIKHELGISAAALTAPPEMNENTNLPWYSMNTGTRHVQVYTTGNGEGKRPNEIVVITVVHENSTRCTHKYFYADTLEFAVEYTENRFWNDLREIIGSNDINKICDRTGKVAHEAWCHHLEKEAKQNNL